MMARVRPSGLGGLPRRAPTRSETYGNDSAVS